MAAKNKEPVNERMRLIDPIYKKFTTKAFQSMTSSEFYSIFQEMMANGAHEFQFSNRKLDKQVDETWVTIIEDTIPALDEICRNPRVIITQEELITNVVQAKKINSQVVRYLCSHGNLIDYIDEDGEVRPSKVLNLFKEESWDTYENRFVYTLILLAFEFVDKRYKELFKQVDDEYGANLLIDSTAASRLEKIHMKMELKILQVDDFSDTSRKKNQIFERIRRIHEVLGSMMENKFSKEMKHFALVKPPLVPTNAIKKNPLLRKCVILWDFLQTYKDVGYSIEVIEQSPEIDKKFEQDILNDIMFTYIILKGYLEDKRDRAIDSKMKVRKRKFNPKYIRDFVEELVRDYDLPDVEIRKVLIEEVTKAQLMKEQEEERFRLVQEREREKREQEKRKEQEKQKALREKEKEAERLQKEKEKERLRQEKLREQEALRKKREQERREQTDQRRSKLFEDELKRFRESLEKQDIQKQNQQMKTENEKASKAAKAEKVVKDGAAAKAAKKTKTPVEVPTEVPVEILVEEPLREDALTNEQGFQEVPFEELEFEEIQAEEIQAEEVQTDEIQAEEVQTEEIPAEGVQTDEIPESESTVKSRFRLPSWLKGRR